MREQLSDLLPPQPAATDHAPPRGRLPPARPDRGAEFPRELDSSGLPPGKDPKSRSGSRSRLRPWKFQQPVLEARQAERKSSRTSAAPIHTSRLSSQARLRDWCLIRPVEKSSHARFCFDIRITVDQDGRAVARQHVFKLATAHSQDFPSFSPSELPCAIERSNECLSGIRFVYIEIKPVRKINGDPHIRVMESLEVIFAHSLRRRKTYGSNGCTSVPYSCTDAQTHCTDRGVPLHPFGDILYR